ncbi:MAG: glycosyltransferase family 4 protein [Thermoproteota archaeon]|nr:glycosyltransferase family 4 protein [Thermoproteota archaeon]
MQALKTAGINNHQFSMRKAVVIHHTLNTLGGETTVAIETIESLHELGYEVELVTVQPPDLDSISRAYGKKIRIESIRSLLPFKLNYFGVYQRLLTMLSSIDFKDSEVVINTHGDALPYRISGTETPYLLYLHFPTFLMGSNARYGSHKYRKSLFWKLYFKPYSVIAKHLAMRAITKSSFILTNSRFSREAIRQSLPDAHPYVLYPPVDIERFSHAYRHPINARDAKVLVISRFSPEKQLENAITIARFLGKKIKFHIVGSLAPANRTYFGMLQDVIRNNGMTQTITLTPNASNEELLHVLSESTIYLHTMIGEHFGVAIVEAMAAGLVPIVPAYGGCSEIVPHEYQYHSLEEAAQYIARNAKDPHDEKRRQMHEISERFSPDIFRKEMKQYIEQARSQIKINRSSTTTTAG